MLWVLLANAILWADICAKELLVKYPPMTKEEMVALAEKAARYMENKIQEGKVDEALEEFNLSPRFQVKSDGWNKLKQIYDKETIKKLDFLNDWEFDEYTELLNKLNEAFGKEAAAEMRKTILRYADEVFSTAWAKGSLEDYRFIVSYNCEKNIHTSHPTLKFIINKPVIDRLKDLKGKRYVYELCNKVLRKGKGTWVEAWQPFPGKAENEGSRMVAYMTPVRQSSYQIGIISRNIVESIEVLDALVK